LAVASPSVGGGCGVSAAKASKRAPTSPIDFAVVRASTIKLQMNARMKGRPAGLSRLHIEAKLREIEYIDKRVDGFH
jgi:hypothetical protein